MWDHLLDYDFVKLSDLINRASHKNLYKTAFISPESFFDKLMMELPEDVRITIVGKPEVDAGEFDLGNGHGFFKKIRKGGLSIGTGSGIRDMEDRINRKNLSREGTHFCMKDMFPVSNPADAIMSLIYGALQKDSMPGFDKVESGAESVLGKDVVASVMNFINKMENGEEIFTDNGKKITVTIADEAAASDEASKIEKLPDEEITEEVKEAILNNYVINNLYSYDRKVKLYKRAGMVNTSLKKLADAMTVYAAVINVAPVLDLLQDKMDKGFVVTANMEVLAEIKDKLAEVMKGLNIDNEIKMIEELLNNTNIPADEGGITHINGYPIDLEKVKSFSYDEASKAFTPSVANLIFADDKSGVDLEKLKNLVSRFGGENPPEGSTIEMLAERIIEPLLEAFAPDEEIMEDSGI